MKRVPSVKITKEFVDLDYKSNKSVNSNNIAYDEDNSIKEKIEQIIEHTPQHGDDSHSSVYLKVETDPIFTSSPAAEFEEGDKEKLDNIEENSNNYIHPVSHPPSIITQDINNKFVNDIQINIWNNKQNALGFTPENSANKGQNSGYASLDVGGKVPVNQLPSTVMEYHGNWNASTNIPPLVDGTGDAGDVYIVSVGGTRNLGSGNITFAAGDWVIYNGSIWEKSINSSAVVSVNTQQGIVVLDQDHIGNGTIYKQFSLVEKTKLANIDDNANNYTHPDTHPPSIIEQNINNRFVTDIQINTWNSKENSLGNPDTDGHILSSKADGTRTWIDVLYSGTSERNVGGIIDGFVFTDATFEEIIDQLIKQEKFPTLTNPSSTFTSSITGFREVGESINITFNSTFVRGSIEPQYTAGSPYRSGLPNEYRFTGTNLTNQFKIDLSDSQTVTGYIVLIGTQTWQGRVHYDVGVQPKSSYDNDYSTALEPGNTSYISRSITGVYPYFGCTVDILTMTKQSLATHGSVIIIDLVAETPTDKQSIETPLVWGSLSTLQQWNSLSSSWDTIDLATFTVTDIINTIQSSIIDYKKYTHNGAQIGARRLRFTF